ncbi:MAG: amidase [Alphaproteobacteria bacterium]|nr:amidase [Alphaproteobacteria bacterium]
MASELWQLDAVDQARLIRTGRASAREAVASSLARLEAVNPQINAVVQFMAEEALAAADAADTKQARGEALPPLHGVPVTIKVNTDQVGYATTNGVVAFKDAVAKEDAPVVANLRAAGGIIIGRTNLPAFSMRVFSDNALHGRTLNPLDPTVSAGGSSGGAGAATATGIGAIAHGNDIGGSVRIPAMYNGVVGLRPSLGRVAAFNPSQQVARPFGSQMMAVQGPHTRSVRDCRVALAAMAKGDPRDTRWVDAPLEGPALPKRVALVVENPGGTLHPAQAEAVRTAGKHLAAAGYEVEEVSPPNLNDIVECWMAIGANELFPALLPRMRQLGDPDGIASMETWNQLVPPSGMARFLQAIAERDLFLWRWLEFMQTRPLVVLPTMGSLAPVHGLDTTLEGQKQVLDQIRVSLIAPVLGLPSLAVPVGWAGRLRPGVQIMAPRFREDLCLEAGEVIEAAEGVVVPVEPFAG